MTDPSIDRGCIEAETLAVWAEGALPASQAAAIEAHVSDCARCQELVATFALTEPEAAAMSPAFVPARAPWLLRWWLPLAGGLVAATMLIVAVARRESVAPPQPETQTAKIDAAAPPSIALRTEPEAAPAPPVVAAPKTPQPPRAAASKKAPAPKFTLAPEPAALTALTATAPAALPAPPPPPPQLLAPIIMAPRPAAQFPPTGVVGGVAGGVAGSVVGGITAGATSNAGRVSATDIRAERTITARDEMQFARIVEFASPAAVGGGGGGRGGSRITTAMTVAATGAVARWRVTTSTKVERSIDNGTTWTNVDLGAGPVAITNGSAPSFLTCWLVGKAGLVLRSADSITFARVTFPEALDLVAVTATDLVHATVTVAGGRQFATDDGGLTWTERQP